MAMKPPQSRYMKLVGYRSPLSTFETDQMSSRNSLDPMLPQIIFTKPIQSSIHHSTRLCFRPLVDIMQHRSIEETRYSRYRYQVLTLVNSGRVAWLHHSHPTHRFVNGYSILVNYDFAH